MKAFVAISFLLLSGCGATLRPDSSIPAIDAGYPTAEITVSKTSNCERSLGLVMCSINFGDQLSDLDIGVQGYYQGSMRIVSTNCQYDQTFMYKDSQNVKLNLTGTAQQNCLFSFTVSPDFSSKQKDGLVVYSLRGHLAVRVTTPGEKWLGSTRKLAGSFKSDLMVPVSGGNAARVVLRGCGINFDKMLPVSDGSVKIHLQDAIVNNYPSICILDGFVLNSFSDISLNVLVAMYDPKFQALPIPIVEVDSKKFTVNCDPQTSVVAVDSKYVISYLGSFDFDPASEHTLRCLTVKGRSILGFWSQSGEWTWKQ